MTDIPLHTTTEEILAVLEAKEKTNAKRVKRGAFDDLVDAYLGAMIKDLREATITSPIGPVQALFPESLHSTCQKVFAAAEAEAKTPDYNSFWSRWRAHMPAVVASATPPADPVGNPGYYGGLIGAGASLGGSPYGTMQGATSGPVMLSAKDFATRYAGSTVQAKFQRGSTTIWWSTQATILGYNAVDMLVLELPASSPLLSISPAPSFIYRIGAVRYLATHPPVAAIGAKVFLATVDEIEGVLTTAAPGATPDSEVKEDTTEELAFVADNAPAIGWGQAAHSVRVKVAEPPAENTPCYLCSRRQAIDWAPLSKTPVCQRCYNGLLPEDK